MKKTQKALLLVLCAVLLVATTVFTTIAFLTDSDVVKNTFTIGKVDITLDEAKVNPDGTKVDETTRVQANTYKLMPGHTYTKDPTIHVASGSEACYLFVKVENGISAIEDSTNSIAKQMKAHGWIALSEGSNIYVYVGTEGNATAPKSVSAGADVVVFEQFEIGDSIVDFNGYASQTITITGYAVQTDGFDDKTAAEIWQAAFASGN